MRRGLLAFLVLWLVACAPTYLGSVPYYPYDLDDFPVFTSPAGLPLFGRQRYEERRWTAIARGPSGTFGFFITLEFGVPHRPTPPFPDPVEICRFARSDERPASAVRVVLLEVPPGFGVRLEKASYNLSCGRLERDTRGFEVLRYTTWLEVLYRFELPPVAPGTYPLRWQLWQGERLIAEEDRRFTLTAGR
jgi:hypothetical protein